MVGRSAGFPWETLLLEGLTEIAAEICWNPGRAIAEEMLPRISVPGAISQRSWIVGNALVYDLFWVFSPIRVLESPLNAFAA